MRKVEGLTCGCGAPKGKQSKQCRNCYHKPWNADEDGYLAASIHTGLTHARMAAHLGRSIFAVRTRSHSLGLKMPASAVLANRREGMDKFLADPVRKQAKSKKLSDRYTPARRRALAEAMKGNTRTFGSWNGRKQTPEAKAKISKKKRAQMARRVGVPQDHPLFSLYCELRSKVGAAGARRIVRDEIECLSPFEKQMLRLQLGATIARKAEVPSKAYDYTLGGVSA